MSTFDPSSGASADRADADRIVPLSDLLVGSTVLVVDDEESDLRLLEIMLGGRGGAIVHTLTDPRDTVRECRRLSPNLLMVGLHMLRMDGIEVITEVREQLSGMGFLPIVIMTADITSGVKQRALAAGVNDYLTKPFDHTDVLLRVNNLLKTEMDFSYLRIRNRYIQARLDERTAQESFSEEQHRQRCERIKNAFEPTALRMVFQPISCISDGRIVGVEALARFDITPRRSPDTWFLEAADIGEGVELEVHAIASALDQLPNIAADQFMSVNASPTTIMSARLRDFLADVPHERIVLELTEHKGFDDYTPLLHSLDEFRSLGIRIAIDDAGTGYSGLKHLLLVRPDMIKLDKDLICEIYQDSARRAVVTGLLAVANEMDATVIAEGIETTAEFETLRSLGVPLGQGYHLARPGPPAQLAS